MSTFNAATEFRKLQRAYSEAMWTWATIEADLFNVFMCATSIRADSREAIKASFFAIMGFKMRLDMTHAAANKAWAGSSYLQAWNYLYADCEKQARSRGKIGHLAARELEPEKSHQKRMLLLCDPDTKLGEKTYGEIKSAGYDVRSLRQFHNEWQVLEVKLARFAVWLLVDEASRLRSEPTTDPAHQLRILSGQTTVKLAPLPRFRRS